jgi:hypothetical protein
MPKSSTNTLLTSIEWITPSFEITYWGGNYSKGCKNNHIWDENNTLIILNRSNGKIQRRCRICRNEKARLYLREYTRLNPEKMRQIHRDSQLKRKYGMTWEQKQEMLHLQNYKCANVGCLSSNAGGRDNEWHIDHNHTTGKVRALLCNNCNTALGFAKEDINRLQGLIKYLEKHNA